MEVCKGDPKCSNMNDLKWCKNTTSWNQPTNWTSIYDRSICNLTPQTDSHGQVIPKSQRGDRVYHCYNRADENPYSNERINDGNGTEDESEWLQWINTPCAQDGDLDYKRRCLGKHPEQCVQYRSK